MNIRQFAAVVALVLGAGTSQANTISLFSFTLTELRDVSINVGSPGGTIVSFTPLFVVTPPTLMATTVAPTAANLSFFDLSAGTYQVQLETTTPDSYNIGGTSAVYDPQTDSYVSTSTLNISSVPELNSASLALAGASVLGLIAVRRRHAA